MADRRKVYNTRKPNLNRHQSPTITIKVCNTDFRPLRVFQTYFGGSVWKEPVVKKSHRKKPIYTYRAYVNSSWVLLEKLVPYLIVKKKQAKLALRLYKHMATLNRGEYKTSLLIPKLVEQVASLNLRPHVKDLGNFRYSSC